MRETELVRGKYVVIAIRIEEKNIEEKEEGGTNGRRVDLAETGTGRDTVPASRPLSAHATRRLRNLS